MDIRATRVLMKDNERKAERPRRPYKKPAVEAARFETLAQGCAQSPAFVGNPFSPCFGGPGNLS